MNCRTKIARVDVFCLVHADAVFLIHFTKEILDNFNKSELGYFRFKFNTKALRLQINSLLHDLSGLSAEMAI